MRELMWLGSLVFILWVASAPRMAPSSPPSHPELHTGDLVFTRSKSSRSALIQKASRSSISHVGIVEVTDRGVFVIEAIDPVSRTPWHRFVARAAQRRVTVARVDGVDPEALRRVVSTAKAELGKGYDARYRWDDERLYCSELVVKAFERAAGVELGRRQRLDELDLSAAELTFAKTKGIEAGQVLVTPASLLDSERVTVFARDVAW